MLDASLSKNISQHFWELQYNNFWHIQWTPVKRMIVKFSHYRPEKTKTSEFSQLLNLNLEFVFCVHGLAGARAEGQVAPVCSPDHPHERRCRLASYFADPSGSLSLIRLSFSANSIFLCFSANSCKLSSFFLYIANQGLIYREELPRLPPLLPEKPLANAFLASSLKRLDLGTLDYSNSHQPCVSFYYKCIINGNTS